VEHLSDPFAVLQEMSRVLAAWGVFMVHAPNTGSYLVLTNILAKKLLPRSLILKLVDDGRAAEDI
jgi:ubiquinone/menaquinone biosynthesis C-methylase UbiE